MSELKPDTTIADDVLTGAAEVAFFLFGTRKKRRKIYYLNATSRLPTFKLGSMICARRSKLLEWVAAQEQRLPIGMKPSPQT